jgi:hypothetical protein
MTEVKAPVICWYGRDLRVVDDVPWRGAAVLCQLVTVGTIQSG